ncbi:MAG: hypothetical protein R3B45_17135 [Bdellovibrionota bacterium]
MCFARTIYVKDFVYIIDSFSLLKQRNNILAYAVLSIIIATFNPSLLAKEVPKVPDEYESTAGHSLGFSNAGIAAAGGLSSVKLNPAMLPLERQYQVSAGYHWPSVGREYYQAGIVDSTSSSIAAGIAYTSSQDDYLGMEPEPTTDLNGLQQILYDSPVRKRISLGVGHAFNAFALGIGGQYVEAWNIDNPSEANMIKGNTLGIGVAGLLVPTLRFGVSAENLANDRVKDYAPRIYRAGLAYLLNGSNVSLHLDYRDRQRVLQEQKVGFPSTSDSNSESNTEKETITQLKSLDSEKMVTVSFSARVQNMLRILGAYGHELGPDQRKSLSGGVAVVNNKVSLSYLISRPYLSSSTELHQAINLGLDVAL